jgi:predicted DNA-binding antitoxin AbrB/MazE fold protein
VEANYENGVLKLRGPLPLPEKSHITMTIQTADGEERGAWLKVRKDELAHAWDISDEVFNELLEK